MAQPLTLTNVLWYLNIERARFNNRRAMEVEQPSMAFSRNQAPIEYLDPPEAEGQVQASLSLCLGDRQQSHRSLHMLLIVVECPPWMWMEQKVKFSVVAVGTAGDGRRGPQEVGLA